MAHVNNDPGCACYDCRELRFQCWRVAIEVGCAVLWENGHWLVAPDRALDDLDDELAA